MPANFYRASGERFLHTLRVTLAGLLEQGYEPLAQLDLFFDRGCPAGPEQSVPHGLQFLVGRHEVFKDVWQVPIDLQAHLDFALQAIEQFGQGILIPAQDAPQLFFVAGDGAKDHWQYGLLFGQVVQDAVMGSQIRPLGANLAWTELTHDGRQTAFDDQLDVGPSHTA